MRCSPWIGTAYLSHFQTSTNRSSQLEKEKKVIKKRKMENAGRGYGNMTLCRSHRFSVLYCSVVSCTVLYVLVLTGGEMSPARHALDGRNENMHWATVKESERKMRI
jgi:hypothetical protein